MRLEIETHQDGRVRSTAITINDPEKQLSVDEMLDRFNAKRAALMEGIMEEAIASLIPDGVSIDKWMRAHGITMMMDVSKNARELKHVLRKGKEIVAEVRCKNGMVYAKVSLGRGYAN